jgi:hypothetical protein
MIIPMIIHEDEKGRFHRLDGPAVIWEAQKNNHKAEWWINDHHVTDLIYEWANERDIDLNNLSDIDKVVIALEWGNYNGK